MRVGENMANVPFVDGDSSVEDKYNTSVTDGYIDFTQNNQLYRKVYCTNNSGIEFCRITRALFTEITGVSESYYSIMAFPRNSNSIFYRIELHNGLYAINNYPVIEYNGYYLFVNGNNPGTGTTFSANGIYDLPEYSDFDDILRDFTVYRVGYPIAYHYTNSTVSGPAEAAVGDTVTVSAVPDVGYGITDATTQILVTNNDVAVPYTWDAATNRITFTMPDPS